MTTPASKENTGSSAPSRNGDQWAGTLDAWKARSIHHAELPSTIRVTFRILSLGWLITNDALPEDLRELAAAEFASPGEGARRMASEFQQLRETSTAEEIEEASERATAIGRDLAALNRHLCAASLLDPVVTADDLADPSFPIDDLEMLGAILTRRLAFDAAGRQVGVEQLDTFATFRDKHGCAPDCVECEAARAAFSTVHLGSM